MKGKCAQCGTKESHAWKNNSGKFELCGDCAYVSANHVPLHVKKQQKRHEKDLVQPYKYDKHEKGMIPNKDFEKVYGKKKTQAFSSTIQTEQERRGKDVGLCQAVKSAPTTKDT